MLRRFLPALCAVTLAAPAHANDSTAELGTGGLILSRSDVIFMEKEELFISPDRVTVDYVFHNRSQADVETIVAFPMPDIDANSYGMPAIPDATSDNFLGFEVSIDDAPVEAQLAHRAVAVGIDVTADLEAAHVPLFPFTEVARAALEALPQKVADDWLRRGIIVIEEYGDGEGWHKVRAPYWTLKSTYWWPALFPAGQPVKVAHRYKPSVGGTAGLTFFSEGKFGVGNYDAYKARYCMDAAFERAVQKAAAAGPDGFPALYETRLSYVLTTGGNWATGSIGDFRLTVDKGRAGNLVSFCGEGVKKVGPTTFEMRATDFNPQRDLDILILGRFDDPDPTATQQAAPAPGGG